MIAWLEGVLREKGPTRLVVDVRGVGYEVLIPLSTFSELPDEGKTVALHVHTHAREGAIQLFGFASIVEREVFEMLLRANRVGPKLAQTMLSGLSADALLAAIRSGDLAGLKRIPGVGGKTAERIAVELRERAAELALAIGADSVAGATAADAPRPAGGAAIVEEVVSALVNLGYTRAQAERVAERAASEAGEGASIEAVIRAALRGLARS